MDITAIVLAGGRGTRIAALYPDIPKPMIPVAGRPFLAWVTEWLRRQGVTKVIFSIGHLAGQIEAWAASAPPGLSLHCVVEAEPLGTGGAIRNCIADCGEWVLAVNGDSLVAADLRPLLAQLAGGGWDGALLGVEVADTRRFGSLDVGPGGRLRGFVEKRPGSGLINAGVYLLRRSLLDGFPDDRPLSMEADILPSLLRSGAALAAWPVDAPFLDIGTPESVVLAEEFVTTVFGRPQTVAP